MTWLIQLSGKAVHVKNCDLMILEYIISAGMGAFRASRFLTHSATGIRALHFYHPHRRWTAAAKEEKEQAATRVARCQPVRVQLGALLGRICCRCTAVTASSIWPARPVFDMCRGGLIDTAHRFEAEVRRISGQLTAQQISQHG